MDKKLFSKLRGVYDTCKEKHPDAVILLRVGDSYHTFGEDAQLCRRLLTMSDTTDHEVTMFEFPAENLDSCLRRLIDYGRRVAITDTIDVPEKLAKRGEE